MFILCNTGYLVMSTKTLVPIACRSTFTDLLFFSAIAFDSEKTQYNSKKQIEFSKYNMHMQRPCATCNAELLMKTFNTLVVTWLSRIITNRNNGLCMFVFFFLKQQLPRTIYNLWELFFKRTKAGRWISGLKKWCECAHVNAKLPVTRHHTMHF